MYICVLSVYTSTMAAAKKQTKKATRKVTRTTPKRVRSAEVMSMDAMTEMETPVVDRKPIASFLTKKNIIVVLLLASFGYLLFLNRGLFIAAMVNNQPITRLSIVSELEKRSGKQALDTVITETLIMQEAQKNNVVVSNDEVDAEVSKVEENVKAQGQDIDQLLAAQGMKKEDLVKQIRIQKIVEKILADKINPTDDEVKKYVTDNATMFGKELSADQKVSQAKDQLKQQKLSSQFQTWIAEVKTNSKINYFVNY